MHSVSYVCLFLWVFLTETFVTSLILLRVVLWGCLWAKFTLNYTEETLSSFIQMTCHIRPLREKKNWMVLINSWLQSCWVAKQCSHSFLNAAGFEKPCGMSGHTHADNPHQMFSKPDEIVFVWPQWVRDCAGRANAHRLNSALTHVSV